MTIQQVRDTSGKIYFTTSTPNIYTDGAYNYAISFGEKGQSFVNIGAVQSVNSAQVSEAATAPIDIANGTIPLVGTIDPVELQVNEKV